MTYPTAVWDGDSENRDSDDALYRSPDAEDWGRMIAEVAATQTRVNNNASGIDPDDDEHSVGTAVTTSGVTTTEKGDPAVHKTVIDLDEIEMATTDGGTPGSDGHWGTMKLYTFPKGHIAVLSCAAQFELGGIEAVTGGGVGLSSTADMEIGIGSAAAAQAGQFDLQATEYDLSSAVIDVDLTSKTSDALESDVESAVTELDGSSTASSVYINMRTRDDADAGTVADVLKISGKVTLLWSFLTKGY